MAKINLKALNIAIERPVQRACRQIATRLANEKFDKAKEDFLNAFLNDPTSQQIMNGSGGGLNKVKGNDIEGTLFGFIGFHYDTDPIGELYKYLNDNIKMAPVGKYDGKTRTYHFAVYIPTREDIEAQTPMPWSTSKSWVYSIESGISGLNRYLFVNRGRSLQGVQVKGNLKSAKKGTAYKPRKYMSSLLNFLKKQF